MRKNTKYSLAYLSGQCYIIIKDYRKAAEMLSIVKDETRRFPKAALLYARALKQDEQYELAIEAFEYFMNKYSGSDASQYIAEINMEIEGCKLGKRYQSESEKSPTRIRHLGASVNTAKTEFAPTPYGTDELLFSSTKGNGAQIFSTSRTHRGWTSPELAKQLGSFKGENICNAAFSPDEKRMYFTVCRAEESWGELTTRCQIYMTKRTGNLWSTPEILPDVINMTGYTTTHPNVVHTGGMEVLYFSSNRPGGQGDMDIWYTVRDLSGSDMEFANPKNLGLRINTPSNEITPFYDHNEAALYFSSNGHPSSGGLDVFIVKGDRSTWDKPENIGFPYNSGADDFFFVKHRHRNDGFLVSNRLNKDKHSTRHEDIFEFRERSEQVYVVKGSIFNQDTNERMPNVEVSVYEVTGAGVEKFVKTAKFTDGRYSIQVQPSKQYKIVADKKGYQPTTLYLDSKEHGTKTEHFYLSIFKEGQVIDTPPKPVLPTGTANTSISSMKTNTSKRLSDYKPAEPVITRPSNPRLSTYNEPVRATYVYTPSNPKERMRIETNAPKHQGSYYKVQLSAVKDFGTVEQEFERLKHLGRIDTERLMDKGLIRVLLADFFDKTDAIEAMKEVRRIGYSSAFLVRYQNGERGGRTK
ncbi:MAG: hypothetical protein AAF738_04785 [Bacteroidota bacterium]